MSDSEESGGGAHAAASHTSNQASGEGSDNMASAMPTLPSGLKRPPPLKTDGNLATNWVNASNEPGITMQSWPGWSTLMKNTRWQCALSVIEDALEIFDGMDFTPKTDNQVLNKVVEKFEEFCIGETNETYERFIFNRRDQEENESIDQYVTVLGKLAQTCNFRSCLHDSLI